MATGKALDVQVEGGPFSVVYADPPWKYNRNTVEEGKLYHGTCSEKKYPLVKLADLKATELPVADDAVLFLWVLNGYLPQGLDLLSSWGFTYSTVAFVWTKTTSKGNPRTGLGPLTLPGAELCLLGRRGRTKDTVLLHYTGVRQVQSAPVGKHSRKPDCFRQAVETLTPGQNRLELFARERHRDWSVWGNEV